MPLIPWLKKVFGPKAAPKKDKELTDEQLALLKSQYKKIQEYASGVSDKKWKDNQKYVEEKNSKCPKCGSTNVNDRIKRFEGKVRGSSSGYGWSALSFGESYSSGSIKGDFDTNEVNKCNDCENEWKKHKIDSYYSTRDIIGSELRCIRCFFRDLYEAEHNVTWDKNDLKETFNNLEEKKTSKLKEAQNGTWAWSIKNFWRDYSIELINKLAEEYLSSSEKKDWEKYYDYDALKKYIGLRGIDEFIKP